MTEPDPPEPDAAAPGRRTVRLRPKAGHRLAEGYPWVWADEIVMDRRTRAIPPGTVATLESPERAPLATVAFNPESTIAARVLDRDPAAEPDAAWFAHRLRRALSLRETLFEAPFYRLVHAEGDGLPGLVIDRFGPALAIQPNAAWAEARLDALLTALDAVLAPETVVLNAHSRARSLEGLSGETRLLRGTLDGPLAVPMNGATYMADLIGGQKTGLFYDQRPNHAFAARLGRGRRVLDVFSHVGGFGLAALAAGAESVLAVDGSAPALALAEEGARRTAACGGFATRKGDAFDTMKALAEGGECFGLVVCDPPAFAPAKPALAAGLRAYERTARLAARLVETEGWLVLCSCSHAADLDAFAAACAKGIRAAGREASLVHVGRAGPDHPVHLALPETSYLKALFYRVP
jgi:23S rRNA (cytosine1962-C5)-methyltransferase